MKCPSCGKEMSIFDIHACFEAEVEKVQTELSQLYTEGSIAGIKVLAEVIAERHAQGGVLNLAEVQAEAYRRIGVVVK